MGGCCCTGRQGAWSLAHLPVKAIRGRTILVTGANSGLGYETVLQSVLRSGEGQVDEHDGQAAPSDAQDAPLKVILACRSVERAQDAIKRVKAACIAAGQPQNDAQLVIQPLDLASFASVRACADTLLANGDAIDILCNNAGVMAPAQHLTTENGHELQFQTNHLSHMLLTLLLEPLLLKSQFGARVVTVSSVAHRMASGWFSRGEHWQPTRSYWRWFTYGNSKLANLLFTRTLVRKYAQDGSPIVAITAHPGSTRSSLLRTSLVGPNTSRIMRPIYGSVATMFSWSQQSTARGTLPQLMAMWDTEGIAAGDFVGPNGFQQIGGKWPCLVQSTRAGRDDQLADQLWEYSLETIRPFLETTPSS